MSIKEKVAYLKGLSEGLGLDSESKEGKLISVIIDTLSDMAEEVDLLRDNALDLGEEIDEISKDLSEVEEFLFSGEYDDDDFDFGGFDDDDDDDDFDDEDCDCEFCSGHDFAYQVECPSCGADINLDEADLANDSVKCPTCGEELEFEFEDDEDGDGDGDEAMPF